MESLVFIIKKSVLFSLINDLLVPDHFAFLILFELSGSLDMIYFSGRPTKTKVSKKTKVS